MKIENKSVRVLDISTDGRHPTEGRLSTGRKRPAEEKFSREGIFSTEGKCPTDDNLEY
jgi:hypothetical protein